MIGSDMIKSAKGQGLPIDEGADATSNLVEKDQMKIAQPTKNFSKEPEEMASFIAADVTDKTGKPVVLGKLSDPAVLISEDIIEKPKALIYKSEDQVICITENISESAKDSKEQSVALAQTELENSITDGKTLVSETGRAISTKINKDKSKSLFGGIFGKAGEVSNEKKRHVVDSVSNISESAGADKNKTTIFSREVEEKANNLTIDGKQIVKGVATSGDTSKTTTSKTASVDVDVDDTTEIKVGGVTTTNQPKNDVTTEAEGRATLLSNIMAETKENVVLGQNKLTDTAVSVTEDTVRKATAITAESKSKITVAAKSIGESADEVKDQFLNIAKCEIELAGKTVEGGKTKVSDTGKVVSKKAKGAKDKSKSFFGGIFNKAGEIVDDGKTKVVKSVSAATETATVAKEKSVTFSEDIVEKADDLSRSVKSKVEHITVISGEVVSSAKEKTMSIADKEVDIAANIVKDGKNKLIQSTKDTSNGAEVKTITSSADLTDKPKENLALSKDTLSKSTIVLKKGIAEKAKDIAGDSKVKVVDTVDDICESVKDVKDKAIEQSHSMIEEMEKSVEHGKKKFDNTGKALGKKAKGAKDKSKTFFGGIFSKAGEIVDDGKIKVAASVSAASETAVVEKDKIVTFSDDITEKADDLSGDTKSKAEAMIAPVGKIEKSAKEKAVSIADKVADKSSNLLSVGKTTIIHITDVSKGVEEKSLSLSADVVDKTKEIIVSGKDTLSDSTIFITDSLTEKAKRIDDKSAEKMVGTIEDIHESASGAKGKAFGKLETGLEKIEKAAKDGKTNLSDTGKTSSEKAKGAKDQSKIFFSGTFGKDGEIEDDEKSNLVDSVSGVSKVDSVSKESPVVFRGSKANNDLVSSGETVVKDVEIFADETTKSAKDISISTSINRANLGNETTIIQPTLDVFKEDEKSPALLNAHVTEKSTKNVVLSKDSIFELSDSTITLTEDIPANARDFTGDSKANVFEQVENFLGFNQGAKDQTIEKIQKSSLKIGETVRDEKTLLINAKKPASKTKELEDESKNLFSEMFFKAGEILDNGKSKLVDSASAIPDTEAQSKDKTVKCGGDIVHKVDDLAFSGKTKVDDVAMLVGDFVKSAKEAVISSANEGDDKTANLLIESKTTITQSAKDAYKAAAGKPVSVLAANVADKTKETTELGKEKLETAVFVAEGLVQKANDISEDVEANVVDTKKEIIVSTKRLKDQTIAIAQNKFEEVGKASVCDTGKAISKEAKDKGEIFVDSILSKSLKVVDDGETKVGNSASNIADTSNLIKDKTLSFSQGAVDNASPLISGGKDKIKDVTVVVGDPVIKSKDKALSAVMDYSDKATTDIREGEQKNVQVTQLVETSFDREAADVSNDIKVAQVSMKRKFTDNISFDPKDIVKTTNDKLDKVKDQLDCNTKQVRGSSNNVNNQTDFDTEVASKKVVTPTVVSKVDLGETKSVEFDLSISETGISTEKAKSFLEGIFTKAEEIADESKGLAKELTYPTSQSTKEDESSSDSKTKRPNEKSEKSRALNERKAVDTTKRVTETTQDPKDQTESVPLSAMKVGESLKEVLETAVFDRKTIVDQIQPTVDQLSLKTSEVNRDRTIKPCEKNIEGKSKFTETLRSSIKPAVGFEETTVTGTTELGSTEEFCDITKTTLCSKDDHASFVKGQKKNMKVSLSENVNKGKEDSEFLLGSISSKSVKKGETNKKEVVGIALSIKQSVDDTKHDTPSFNLPSISTQKSTQEANTKNNDDKLNNILIDMLIEQECMKTPSHDVSSLQASEIKNQFSAEASSLPEKHDIEVSEKAAMSVQSGSFKTAASFGEIESLISEKDLKMEITKEVPTRHTSYVTTPTMQRRKIGGSQRLSREERPSLRDVSHILDYSSSDEDETNNYIVTEPSDRSPQSSVIFHVESEDESYLKMSDSSSDPEIEVTEMSPSPISSSKKQRTLPVEEIQKHAKDPTKSKVKSDKNIQKVERRFERMASETLETDPASKYSADREFQRMVSQLSNEEVDACLNQWDEGGLTPSEELDSTKDTIEGDLDPDVEALPEAFIESTNPFFSSSTQWVEFEHDISNTPSSIFWAFDTTPTSAIIQPNELDIPIKTAPAKGNLFNDEFPTNQFSLKSLNSVAEPPLCINTLGQSYSSSIRLPCALSDSPLGALPPGPGGESAGEEAKRSPVPPTTRESEEALLDLAAGLQDNKGSGSGPSSTK